MDFSISLVTDSTAGAMSVQEAKDHLRVDTSDEDTLISAQVAAALDLTETATNRSFVRRGWRLSLPHFPWGDEIRLPRFPLVAHSTTTPITVKYFARGSTSATTFSSTNYWVDTDAKPGRIVLKENKNWPQQNLRSVNAVQVDFWAGSTAVPVSGKAAIKLLVAHWFANREAATVGSGLTRSELPLGVDALLGPLRVPWVP